MRRNRGVPFALIIAFTMLAGAQDEAPAETPADEPVITQASETMVRFLHAAPNAELAGVSLLDGEGGAVAIDQFAGVSYGELSDYVPIAPGDYEIAIDLATLEGEEAAGVEVPADPLSTFAGEYYTILLTGVVPPGEDAAEDDGFFEWLEELFSGEDDEFALRATVLGDLTQFAMTEGEAEVRIVHAAPGTEAVDLVLVNEDGANVVHSVGFGDVSDLAAFPVDSGMLELRVADSEAVITDLSAQQLEAGTSSTLFLIGTPVEEMPLEVLTVPNPVASTTAVTPSTPGPFAPVAATDRTWLRDSINELEARLAAIEDRLANLAELDGAEEDVTAALQEVEEAMALLADARDRMAALPVPEPETTEPNDPASGSN